MRPREQQRGREDLFRSRLEQIINLQHELVRLGEQIDWRLIGDKLGEVYKWADERADLMLRDIVPVEIDAYASQLQYEREAVALGYPELR